MPKTIMIDPEVVFARDSIHFTDIEVNAYDKTIEEELKRYAKEDLVHMFEDMCAIREFETILNEIKIKGIYKGVAYNHLGPAHLSIGPGGGRGRDGLLPDARRSHLRLAPQPRRDSGQGLLRHSHAERRRTCSRSCGSYLDGAILRPLEKGHSGTRAGAGRASSWSTAPTARSSPARPVSTAAWAARCTPSSRRSASIRTTPSWAARVPSPRARPCSSASTASPASWSPTSATPPSAAARSGKGITFASMDQYRTLWDPALGGGLPIIFNCMNNFYGMGGQPLGETMGCEFIARIGAGVNPEQMHAERVNGYDPLPVIDAFRRKKQLLAGRPGPGPARHGHLPHQRALAVGRLQLPLQGGNREVAEGGFHPRLPRASSSIAAISLESALDETRAGDQPTRSSRCSSWRSISKPRRASPSTPT